MLSLNLNGRDQTYHLDIPLLKIGQPCDVDTGTHQQMMEELREGTLTVLAKSTRMVRSVVESAGTVN
jgi:hypothetical protein